MTERILCRTGRRRALARVVALVVGPVAGLCLPACSDFIDNSLGITGSPSWNRPFDPEGTWQGRFTRATPTRAVRGPPTWLCGGSVDLRVADRRVTGTMVLDSGPEMTVQGQTWAGAQVVGPNLVRAEVFREGRKVGNVMYEPGRGANHMTGQSFIRPGPDVGPCGPWTEIRRVVP